MSSALARTRVPQHRSQLPSVALVRTRTGRTNLARVGLGPLGSLTVTGSDVKVYGARIDGAIQSLYKDVRAQLVYADPTAAQAAATAAKGGWTWPGASSPAGSPSDLPARLQAEADLLKSRAKGRTAEQIKNEISYSTGYGLFYDRWVAFKSSVLEAGTTLIGGVNPDEAWRTVETYETEFRKWYASFAALGGKPSSLPPPTAAEVEKEHPSKPLIGSGGSLLDIPWTPILIVGGILAIGYVMSKSGGIRSATPAEG